LDPTNLYIGNLPSYVTERDLDSLFSPYGRVVSTRILRTSIGMSKRMGFARMESHDKCEAVIAAFNGKILSGSGNAISETK
jgi:RNA recognition motif-containing protein